MFHIFNMTFVLHYDVLGPAQIHFPWTENVLTSHNNFNCRKFMKEWCLSEAKALRDLIE